MSEKKVTEYNKNMTEFWVASNADYILQAVLNFYFKFDCSPVFVMMHSKTCIAEIPHPNDLVIVAMSKKELITIFNEWPIDDDLYEPMKRIMTMVNENKMQNSKTLDIPILAVGLTAMTTNINSLKFNREKILSLISVD